MRYALGQKVGRPLKLPSRALSDFCPTYFMYLVTRSVATLPRYWLGLKAWLLPGRKQALTQQPSNLPPWPHTPLLYDSPERPRIPVHLAPSNRPTDYLKPLTRTLSHSQRHPGRMTELSLTSTRFTHSKQQQSFPRNACHRPFSTQITRSYVKVPI